MISTQDYYTYDDLTVGTAVACIHNGKKYVGIITRKEKIYFELDHYSYPICFSHKHLLDILLNNPLKFS